MVRRQQNVVVWDIVLEKVLGDAYRQVLLCSDVGAAENAFDRGRPPTLERGNLDEVIDS